MEFAASVEGAMACEALYYPAKKSGGSKQWVAIARYIHQAPFYQK
jgi:ABC-type polar amino acid transport system ATPase subunit